MSTKFPNYSPPTELLNYTGNAASDVVDLAGNTVSGVAGLAGNTVSGVAGLAGNTVTGVADLAGNTVTGVVDLAGNTVSGVANLAGNTVSGVADLAGNTVTGVANTATDILSAPLNLLDISLPDYLKSISGGEPSSHRFDNTILLMCAAIFAGYTATSLPKNFLKLFQNPIVQFIVFYIIGITSYGGAMPPGGKGFGPFKVFWAGPYVFLDAILVVCLMQLLMYITRMIYGKDKKRQQQDTYAEADTGMDLKVHDDDHPHTSDEYPQTTDDISLDSEF